MKLVRSCLLLSLLIAPPGHSDPIPKPLPLAADLRTLLPALVRTLATTKGLAGIAFQDTAGIGYLNKSYDFDPEGITLGFTPFSRLAYLRRTHADPVDLSSGYDTLRLSPVFDNWLMTISISLPAFQSNNAIQDWKKVRGESNASLMADVVVDQNALPLQMRERQYGQTFDAWTDPQKLNRYAETIDLAAFLEITLQSVFCLNYGPLERARPERLVFDAVNGGSARRDAFRAGGVLFDMIAGEAPVSLPDSLDKLGVMLKLAPKLQGENPVGADPIPSAQILSRLA